MRRYFILYFIACSIFLSSCSGLKNIQDLTYVTGIGMDYDEEKKEFTVYLQGLDFANVAKQEGGGPTEPIPIFVAKANGETLNLAVSKLYDKTEPPLFFGHVKTLVLSQSVVTHRFKEVIEEIGRNRSIRPTLRVLTTEENIEEVFNIKALFEYPAVYTVLYKKSNVEVLQDEIKPTTLMDFLRDYYEPMGVAKLPNVKIDKDSWKADKTYPVLFFNGYNIFQKQEFIRELPLNQGVFVDWLKQKKILINKRVEEDRKLVAAVKLASPKMKVKYDKGTPSPKFSIELSVQGDLLEKIQDIPLNKLEKLIEEDIKSNLTSIYKDGVEHEMDILNVGEKWYRKHPRKYSKLSNSTRFYLEQDSLKGIKVNVGIIHFNAYNYDRKGYSGYK
jgi:spore germination protein KC